MHRARALSQAPLALRAHESNGGALSKLGRKPRAGLRLAISIWLQGMATLMVPAWV